MPAMSCRCRRSALLAAVALAGCGGHTAQPARHAAGGPCVPAARTAVAPRGVTTRVTAVSPGMATCVYEAPAVRVDVAIDTNPQAFTRFDRAVVERGQNAVWGHDHTKMPRLLNRLGKGADWFPGDRELLTTDGRRLISVKLVRTALHERARQRLARAVAQATLVSSARPATPE
jgi:hypothetical protein